MPAPGPSWMRLDIQGLRAIAVLLVVAYHSGLPLPGGFTGVDVFFVISGYVITELIVRKQSSSGGFGLREFYARRMRRLLPALALVVTLTLIVAIFLESPFGPQRTTALTGLGASFFMANFVIYANTGAYFDAPAELNPLLHTWSLSVEEQFYFVFPALMILAALIAARRGHSSRNTALAILVLVSIGSFVLSIGLGFNLLELPGISDSTAWAFYSSLTRAWEFCAGAILALLLRSGRSPIPQRLAAPTALLGIVAIGLGAVVIDQTMVFPGLVALIPVGGTLALIAAGTSPRSSLITRSLSLPGMVWIGAISYSWYLWHWPIIVFTGQLVPGNETALLLAGLLSLIPAYLAYRFVESPIRNSSRIRGGRLLIVVALSIAIPAAVAVLVLRGSERAWNNPSIASMNEQINPVPISYTRGCDFGTPLGQQEGLDCTWFPDARGGAVYLLGDSQAAQFAEAAIGAVEPIERSLTIATEGSCAFLLRTEGEELVTSPECDAYITQSIDWLSSQPPATVLIGMSGNYVNRDTEADIRERLTRSIETLQMAGHSVALFQAVPQFIGWSPYNCSMLDVLRDPQGCGTSVPRDVMDDQQALALRLLSEIAASTDSTLVDVRADLCPNGSCVTNDRSFWRYRDMFHISIGQSERLSGPVRSSLLRVGR